MRAGDGARFLHCGRDDGKKNDRDDGDEPNVLAGRSMLRCSEIELRNQKGDGRLGEEPAVPGCSSRARRHHMELTRPPMPGCRPRAQGRIRGARDRCTSNRAGYSESSG